MYTLSCLCARIADRSAFLPPTSIVLALLAISLFTVLSSRTFAQTSTFVNPAAITIADNGPAVPAYPSIINVSGTSGRITKVVVTLNGFTHGRPDDVGVLLVGPNGQKVRLMTDVGGSTAVGVAINIPIDDRAAANLPDNTALSNTISKPTLGLSASANDGNTHPADFAAPAPAGPYSLNLSDFIGTGANGAWSLYVDDDTAGNTGSFVSGWTLSITSGGAFTNANLITINDNAPASPYPSTVSVAGFTSGITKVSVRINGLTHTFLDDVGIILVSPTGTAVRLTTDSGGPFPATGINLVFDDTSANALPNTGGFTSTSFKPAAGTNNGGNAHAANFAAPAPAGPYTNTLSTFNGLSANGTWSLFVDDDSAVDVGTIASWTLAIETGAGAPTAADVAISGRVVNSAGRGIAHVRLMLYGGTLPDPIYALTNPFGYYTFGNVPAGQVYIVSAGSKRFRFTDPVRVVNLVDDLAELDFVAEP